MNSYDRAHNRSVAEADKRIQEILDAYERDITRLARTVSVPDGRAFRFSDYPPLRERYDRLIRDLHGAMTDEIQVREKREWERANDKNDDFAVEIIGSQAEATARGYMKRNTEALEAFMARKVAGMTLSDRVWKYTGQYSTEIQDAIDVALRDGASADELSREVRKYLQEPNRLFRRVRDEHGALHLSKNAKAYHPGQGVYRSSYMNARRLATTEINMAYRASDYTRYQQLDFVVGIEVHLSGNHNCKGVPAGMFFDICDELKGRYPKGFQFTGWHPNCRCYSTTILKTKEEMKLDAARIRQGEAPAEGSVNTVDQLPEGFTKWLSDNQQRVVDAKRLPYFLTQNGRMSDGTWEPFKKIFPAPPSPTLLEAAQQRHAERTEEQVERIRKRWAEREEAYKALDNLESEFGRFVDFNIFDFEALYGKYNELYQAVNTWYWDMEHSLASMALIDNPRKWAEKFSISQLADVQSAVEAKLHGWSSLTLKEQKKKLEYEINWVEQKKKYATWEVAQSAYRKELAKVNDRIAWDEVAQKYSDISSFKTKSKNWAQYIDEYWEAVADDDIAAAEAAVDKAEKLKKRLEAQAARRASKRAANGNTDFDREYEKSFYTDNERQEYDRLLKKFDDALSAAGGDHWDYSVRAAYDEMSEYLASLGEKYFDVIKYNNGGGKTADEVAAAMEAYLKATPKDYNGIYSGKVGGDFSSNYMGILAPASQKYGIPAEELSLITRYTAGSGFINDYKYKTSGWKYTEAVLGRQELDELKNVLDNYETAMNGVLDRMPKYNGHTYRGVNFAKGGDELLKELKACAASGEAWESPSFMSTATDIGVTSIFGSDIVILIEGKTGVDIRKLSHFGNSESEVLFRSGTKFRVKSIKESTGKGIARRYGAWEVVLEEVL